MKVIETAKIMAASTKFLGPDPPAPPPVLVPAMLLLFRRTQPPSPYPERRP